MHSDIYGLMNVHGRNGVLYFITIINDFMCFGLIYLISHKYEVLDCYMKFLDMVENWLDKTIKVLRKNRGREYLCEQFKQLCQKRYSKQLFLELHNKMELLNIGIEYY